MEQSALESLLNQLIAGWENEVVEFKQPDHSYSTPKIGQYFSALSNEANLRNEELLDNLRLKKAVNPRVIPCKSNIYQ